MIVDRCKHINSIEEVEPVGVAGQVEGQFVGLGIVTVGIEPLGERTCNERTAVHLCETGQIETHFYRVATMHNIADGVALCLRTWLEAYTR